MPYGPSVPHMFIVVFLIMLPIYLKTNDPVLAWRAGLAWAFIIGVIVPIGAFVGPTIRRYTPRAAMLGTLADIPIGFISMRPVFQMWELPWIAFVAFAISLIGWTANVRLPGGLPGGLAAVTVGTVLARLAVLLGWTGYMEPSASRCSSSDSGCRSRRATRSPAPSAPARPDRRDRDPTESPAPLASEPESGGEANGSVIG